MKKRMLGLSMLGLMAGMRSLNLLPVVRTRRPAMPRRGSAKPRSKMTLNHRPHQGDQERARRVRQIAAGQISPEQLL